MGAEKAGADSDEEVLCARGDYVRISDRVNSCAGFYGSGNRRGG